MNYHDKRREDAMSTSDLLEKYRNKIEAKNNPAQHAYTSLHMRIAEFRKGETARHPWKGAR